MKFRFVDNTKQKLLILFKFNRTIYLNIFNMTGFIFRVWTCEESLFAL
jgi:hypothetical protein